MAQLVRPSLEKPKQRKSIPQAMAVSTREKRKKPKGKEYKTPPPIPYMPKESLNITKCLESLRKKSGKNLVFVAYTTTCNTLPQNVGHDADWSTEESMKAP